MRTVEDLYIAAVMGLLSGLTGFMILSCHDSVCPHFKSVDTSSDYAETGPQAFLVGVFSVFRGLSLFRSRVLTSHCDATFAHYSGLRPLVAHAMIQPNDAIIQSNAVAALSASSQPRRAHLAMHAYEIWPNEPEVLDKPLHDKDGTVRTFSLTALCSFVSRFLREIGPPAKAAVAAVNHIKTHPRV